MRQFIKRSIRPSLEAMEGRRLLSATWHGPAVPQPVAATSRAVPSTGVESGTRSVRIERTSGDQDHFRFRGQGTLNDLGPVRVTGVMTIVGDDSPDGMVTGVLRLTLPGGMGTARVLVSQTIPAHSGSVELPPFPYTVSGGTGLFRRGFSSATGTLTLTTTTPIPRAEKVDITGQVFSDQDDGRQPRPTASPGLNANPTGIWYWTFQQCCG